MAHLDNNIKSSPTIRTSIAGVLSKIIAIAAGESVGEFSTYLYIASDHKMLCYSIITITHCMY